MKIIFISSFSIALSILSFSAYALDIGSVKLDGVSLSSTIKDVESSYPYCDKNIVEKYNVMFNRCAGKLEGMARLDASENRVIEVFKRQYFDPSTDMDALVSQLRDMYGRPDTYDERTHNNQRSIEICYGVRNNCSPVAGEKVLYITISEHGGKVILQQNLNDSKGQKRLREVTRRYREGEVKRQSVID